MHSVIAVVQFMLSSILVVISAVKIHLLLMSWRHFSTSVHRVHYCKDSVLNGCICSVVYSVYKRSTSLDHQCLRSLHRGWLVYKCIACTRARSVVCSA